MQGDEFPQISLKPARYASLAPGRIRPIGPRLAVLPPILTLKKNPSEAGSGHCSSPYMLLQKYKETIKGMQQPEWEVLQCRSYAGSRELSPCSTPGIGVIPGPGLGALPTRADTNTYKHTGANELYKKKERKLVSRALCARPSWHQGNCLAHPPLN